MISSRKRYWWLCLVAFFAQFPFGGSSSFQLLNEARLAGRQEIGVGCHCWDCLNVINSHDFWAPAFVETPVISPA